MLPNRSYTYAYSFWILSSLKMKLDQILVCCLKTISNMFLAQCWRLETSPRPFYNFIKMAIYRDLTIFNGWRLSCPLFIFSKQVKHWNLNIIGYWVIWAGCYIEKHPEPSPSPPICSNDLWKLLPLLISINWPSLVT